MEPKKTSKKSIKTAEMPAAALKATESSDADSKPVKRTAAAKSAKPAPRKASTPKNSSHRHSKLSAPPVAPIDYNEVARLAYKYWEERHYAHGFAEEDWHRAEKAVGARASQ
jgi:hypothetical protein